MQQPQLEKIVQRVTSEIKVALKDVLREKEEKEKYILLWEKGLRDCEDHKA